MRKVGKCVGTCVYVHRLYAAEVVPADLLKKATEGVNDYTAVKYDTKTGFITLQWSPDFDRADEPVVGKCVLIRPDGSIRVMPPKKDDPMIWHHKWMWVGDNYLGFDVEASKARSALWEPHVSAVEKRRIGRRSFWNSIRSRWEDKI